MYQIVLSQDAQNQLQKLEKELQKRIVNVLKRVVVRPVAYLERLTGVPYYKLRIGDYRVIIDLKTNENILFVMKIGHRKDIYKKLNL